MTHKLSVHVGNRPTGLQDFERTATPAVIYCLNNTIEPVSPHTITIRRIQNDVWGRLPDAMSVTDYFLHVDPVAAARHELTEKTIYVPKRGRLNLLDYWRLGYADYYAPYNEPVLGESVDHILKARWLNDYTCEALEIAHNNGLKLCVGSFATGNPHPDTWGALTSMVAMCAAYGGLIDLHEYGVEGPLMSSPSSGALRYRAFHDHFLVCPDIVISEFWWGNGFESSGNSVLQINDALAYAVELERDPYVVGACAFQLDQGAESDIPYRVLMDYATAARDLVVTPPPPVEMLHFGGVVHRQYKAELNQYLAERGGRIWFSDESGDKSRSIIPNG